MAHMEKFTKSELGHLFEHYEHKKSRDNVDRSLTHLNYNMADKLQPKDPIDFIHERLKNVRVQNRADVNVVCTWIITQPKEFKGDSKQFMDEAFKFVCNRYGKQNVISAWVHLDEPTSQPHVHIPILPIVENKGKSKNKYSEKLSAKECISLYDLKTFHTDLSKHMESVFGYDIGILNGATEGGNKTIEQLKGETLKQQNNELQAQKEALQVDNDFAQEQLKNTNKVIKRQQDKLDGINKQIDAADKKYKERSEMYDKVEQGRQQNLKKLQADYDTKQQKLKVEYDTKQQALQAEYDAKQQALQAEYDAKDQALKAEYDAQANKLNDVIDHIEKADIQVKDETLRHIELAGNGIIQFHQEQQELNAYDDEDLEL